MPLHEVLIKTRSHKIVQKVTDSLRQFGLGLADNKFIPAEKMVEFVHGVASDNIPQLKPNYQKKQAEEKKKKTKLLCEKTDIFLIVPPPKNKLGEGAVAKSAQNTNDHVMIEFSLRLLHILLKREKVNKPEQKSLLDSLVPVLTNCLKSKHVKVTRNTFT